MTYNRNISIGIIILVAIIFAAIYFLQKPESQPEISSLETKTQTEQQASTLPPVSSNAKYKTINLENVNADYKFSVQIPIEWQTENIGSIDSINIFDPNSTNKTSLEQSQIFIRQFTANDFLTLDTVNVLSKQTATIDNKPAVKYEIEKKPSIANFAGQPSWRNLKHKLIDVRLEAKNPSVFYVISYNPNLPITEFETFIESIKFNTNKNSSELSAPIDRANERILAKGFGLYVTPQKSPVSPERFSGYHTGTDFEILTESEKTDVIAIKAICTGKLLQKQIASGYGGVATQECTINDITVTIVYGHISISSIKQKIGSIINSGEIFTQLGNQGPDTDNERKHLHLGIYKSKNVNLKGYVQSPTDLDQWIDYKSLGIS